MTCRRDLETAPIASSFAIAIAVVLSAAASAQSDEPAWPQWGGPTRDFQLPDPGLKLTWPKPGLHRLWNRPLGDGYSSVVVRGRSAWTMYRADGHEHVIALDARNGKTVWQHRYPARFLSGTNVKEFGPGPLSTPLVVDNRVCTVGVTGILHCLDAETGDVVWQHDLITKLGGTNLFRGYSASPIAWKETVIVPVGGIGQGVVAFRIMDGTIAWKNQDFAVSHSSPILIRYADKDQLVLVAEHKVAGLDPRNGEQLWQSEHPIDGGYMSSTPVATKDGRLFFSAAYGHGSRGLQLQLEDNRLSVRQAWLNKRMKIHHSNVMVKDGFVFGTSGDFGPFFATAVDIESGQQLWQDRQFSRASFLQVGNRSLMLEEDGYLSLVTVSRKGIDVHARTRLFDGRSWTPPSLVGKVLFLRSRTHAIAVRLP